MLALTRRIGEEIVIGDPSNPLGLIRVVDIHGDKVRLAFDFPRETQVNRKELADKKNRDNGSPPPPAAEKKQPKPKDDGDPKDKGNPQDDSDNNGSPPPPDH